MTAVLPTLHTSDSTARAVDLGPAVALSCRECGHRIDLGPFYACTECFGPLEVAYEFALSGNALRERIEAGPTNIWRYSPLLPVPSGVADNPNINPGWTKLIRADNLARELGMKRLWVKDDSGNPTHSFKDRVVAVALAAARELGFSVLACPSTGNLANAVAAAAARAGIRSVVLIPSDLEQQKILTTAAYGGTLVAVDGNYDDINRLAGQIAAEQEDWAFVNVNVRPYYAEGSKTLGFEVAEQLGWRLPEQVVIPIASGAQLVKVDKGFTELGALGLVDPMPYKVFGAQATGCSPVSAAFKAGHDTVLPVRPNTVAKSLAIGNPADGYYAVHAMQESGGFAVAPEDDEILDAMLQLARTEGIFTETAGGVTVAATRRLIAEGHIDRDEPVVICITGQGLKTMDPLVPRLAPPPVIGARLAELDTLIHKE